MIYKRFIRCLGTSCCLGFMVNCPPSLMIGYDYLPSAAAVHELWSDIFPFTVKRKLSLQLIELMSRAAKPVEKKTQDDFLYRAIKIQSKVTVEVGYTKAAY